MQLADKVKKLAGKTHKDRVHEFNSKLEALSEHHDIPKVSTTCIVSIFSPTHLSIRLVLDKVWHGEFRGYHVDTFLSSSLCLLYIASFAIHGTTVKESALRVRDIGHEGCESVLG